MSDEKDWADDGAEDAAAVDYQQETHGVLVRVAPRFMPSQSYPEQGRYVWTYAIAISNRRDETVRLLRRYWRLTDRDGRVEEVRGEGVVGLQPDIAAGQTFEYASAAPLRSASGVMGGHFEMITAGGEDLIVPTPIFSLDSPYETPILN